MSIPKLEPWCNSWVVSCKQTGKAIFETYSEDTANRINQSRYEVKTTYQHLTDLNKKIKLEG